MSQRLKRYLTVLACVASVVVLVSGCGYHVAGRGSLPWKGTTLTIPVFINGTGKPDIESVVTGAFVAEFVSTIDVAENGETVMEGVIKSYSLSVVSYTRSDVNLEYRLTVVLSIAVKNSADGALLWSDDRIVDYEDFLVDSTDVTATDEAELEALRKLSKDTARLVKERMLEAF